MFICFLNPQGNFDRDDSRWASHADFGGQLVYVKELAIELAAMGNQIDIVTRQINDPEWPEFEAAFDSYEGVENLRIVRVPFGGDEFLNKEKLWPSLCPGYVKKLVELYKKEGHMPEIVASHYGDGGLAAAYFKELTGVPYTFTAHSLGAQKMDKMKINKFNIDKLDEEYNFASRLIAERVSMNNARRIITSTLQERHSQYTHTAYQEAVVIDHDEKFSIVPPGVSLRVFDNTENISVDPELNKYVEERTARDIDQSRQHLPFIISSSRIDPKKNIAAMVEAFALSPKLQESANLLIVTRGYDNPLEDYKQLTGEKEQATLIDLIAMIENYKLRGKVSMFSIDDQRKLASMYRYFSDKNAVFCLTASYEPFGLAPLEAMACGLPAVVTKFGGPTESLREGDEDFAFLVDPSDPDDVASGLYSLVSSNKTWQDYSKRGYQRILSKYTWRRTAEAYYAVFEDIVSNNSVNNVFHLEIDKYFTDPDKNEKPSTEILKKIYLDYDIICIGEAFIDFISTKKTNSLRDADNFTRHIGGNPAYVAVYASKLSKKTCILTKLGRGQFGNFLESGLQKYGVCTEFVKYSEEEDTSVTFSSHTPTVPDFQNMLSADRKLTISDIDPGIVERAEVLHTSLSSLSHEPSRTAIRKVLRLGKQSDKIMSLDPNYHPKNWSDKDEALEVLAQITDGVTMVMPSLKDARHIFDYNLSEEELVDLCIEKFHGWGARIVIVRAEDKYAVVSDGTNRQKILLSAIDVVDASGKGASFIAGFIVAYLEKMEMESCIKFGHEVSRLALQSVGPFPKYIYRNEILDKIT